MSVYANYNLSSMDLYPYLEGKLHAVLCGKQSLSVLKIKCIKIISLKTIVTSENGK